jgi:hypothetical protein
MERKYLKSISLIATFGMLALVLSLWTKQPAQSAEINGEVTHKKQTYCSSASNTFYLAEIKPRFSGISAGSTVHAITSNVASLHKIIEFNLPSEFSLLRGSPPLWLLNRALLI